MGHSFNFLPPLRQPAVAPPPSAITKTWPNTTVIDGAIWIDAEYLLDNPFPHRGGKTDEEYHRVEAHILANGQKVPIMVRPAPGRPGYYEICCGHTRRDVAVEHGFTEGVKAEIFDLTDQEMIELAFAENFSRNDLNQLDKVDSLIRIMQGRGLKGEVSPIAHRLKRGKPPQSSAEEADNTIFTAVLAEFGVGLSTFRSWLGMLNNPPDILAAVRDGTLPFSKAVEIAKVTDDKQRKCLLERVFAEDLSVREIKAEIAPPRIVRPPIVQRFTRLTKVEIPPNRQAEIEALLQQLEDLFGLQ